jgi:hypothetical protein
MLPNIVAAGEITAWLPVVFGGALTLTTTLRRLSTPPAETSSVLRLQRWAMRLNWARYARPRALGVLLALAGGTDRPAAWTGAGTAAQGDARRQGA